MQDVEWFTSSEILLASTDWLIASKVGQFVESAAWSLTPVAYLHIAAHAQITAETDSGSCLMGGGR